MAIQPGTYNITLQRRADYSINLQFIDSNKNPIDLTGWTVLAQIWDEARTNKLADFNITYINRVLGKISLDLSDNITTALPRESFYDVLLINTSGLREYYLQGSVSASEGYTS